MSSSESTAALETVRQLKEGSLSRKGWLPVRRNGKTIAWLVPVDRSDVGREDSVALLARWREAAADAFPSQFPVTIAGTGRWLVAQLLDVPDRILFWVTLPDGTRVGHVGLAHFDGTRQVEVDNIVRGRQGLAPGVMHDSIEAMLEWAFTTLGFRRSILHVFADNPRAVRLYERSGFQEIGRIPLGRVEEGPVVRWVETDGKNGPPITRHFAVMSLERAAWQKQRRAAA